MEVLRHFHPFFAFPGAVRVFWEKCGVAEKGSLLWGRAEARASGVFHSLPEGNAGEPFEALAGRSCFWGECLCLGESSGLERMSGMFREYIAGQNTRRFCGAGPGGSGRRKRLRRSRKRVCTARKKKRFIFVHPAPSALWTGPDEDLFNTGTAFAPRVGARRRQRPGADFGRVNHSPQHGRNPCSCIIP